MTGVSPEGLDLLQVRSTGQGIVTESYSTTLPVWYVFCKPMSELNGRFGFINDAERLITVMFVWNVLIIPGWLQIAITAVKWSNC